MSNVEMHGFDPNKYIPGSGSNNKNIASDNNATTKRVKRKNYYKSGSRPGDHIVDAVTGQTYKYKVGSSDESRFFTVMINEGKEGVKLFYSSPEQYETHRHVSLNDSIKIKWKEEEHQRNIEEFNAKKGTIDNDVTEDDESPKVTVVK